MFFQIPRCYDSHLHLLSTGEVASSLNLSEFKSENDAQLLKPLPHHFSGDWLLGFGWDQNLWLRQEFPRKETLDQLFPNHPVAFSRADGHALWVNSLAMKLAGISGNGILIDQEMEPIQRIIPSFSLEQKRKFLFEAVRILNHSGFTHVRDMSGTLEQWTILSDLDRQGLLSLYVEQNFCLDSLQNLNSILELAIWARNNQTKHIRAGAIKYFYDGALGSEGALLSQNYSGRAHSGLRLSSQEEMVELFERCWKRGVSVAVHSIGDQAVHEVTLAAWKVWEKGTHGQIQIEHGELIRPETIALLQKMNSVVHMQPCHWLSDHRWLQDKVGSLVQYAFPWRMLAENKIPLFWGSDTPIERPSVADNLKALRESSLQGIAQYPFDVLLPHSYPDSCWGGECLTQYEGDQVTSVIFDGKTLFSKNSEMEI